MCWFHCNFKSQKQPMLLAPEKSAFCLVCAHPGAAKASSDKSLWCLLPSVAKKACIQHLIWGSKLVRIQKAVGSEGSSVSLRDYHNVSCLQFGGRLLLQKVWCKMYANTWLTATLQKHVLAFWISRLVTRKNLSSAFFKIYAFYLFGAVTFLFKI